MARSGSPGPGGGCLLRNEEAGGWLHPSLHPEPRSRRIQGRVGSAGCLLEEAVSLCLVLCVKDLPVQAELLQINSRGGGELPLVPGEEEQGVFISPPPLGHGRCLGHMPPLETRQARGIPAAAVAERGEVAPSPSSQLHHGQLSCCSAWTLRSYSHSRLRDVGGETPTGPRKSLKLLTKKQHREMLLHNWAPENFIFNMYIISELRVCRCWWHTPHSQLALALPRCPVHAPAQRGGSQLQKDLAAQPPSSWCCEELAFPSLVPLLIPS